MQLDIGIQGHWDSISILHATSSEDGGEISFLTETDSGANFVMVDLDAKELVCWTAIHYLISLQEFHLNLDRSFDGGRRI